MGGHGRHCLSVCVQRHILNYAQYSIVLSDMELALAEPSRNTRGTASPGRSPGPPRDMELAATWSLPCRNSPGTPRYRTRISGTPRYSCRTTLTGEQCTAQLSCACPCSRRCPGRGSFEALRNRHQNALLARGVMLGKRLSSLECREPELLRMAPGVAHGKRLQSIAVLSMLELQL